jgi:hypothetical protein
MATPIITEPRVTGSSAFNGLAEILAQETRGLEEFAEVLERQRGAVRTSDREMLDATTEDQDRLLLRLGKLGQQRQSMVEQLTGRPGERLSAMLQDLGAAAPLALTHAHDALQLAAERAARASRINSVVIRRVLDSERTFLQSLFREGPAVGYPGSTTAPPSGVLLDRQG